MATMKIYMSAFILVGLVKNSYTETSIHDFLVKRCQDQLSSEGRFLDMLSILISKSNKKFTIEDGSEIVRDSFRSDCSMEDSLLGDNTDIAFTETDELSVCHFQKLLGKFNSVISVTKPGVVCHQQNGALSTKECSEITLGVKTDENSFLLEFCEEMMSPITECQPTCPTSRAVDCSTACNNITKPATTTTTTKPTTTSKPKPTSSTTTTTTSTTKPKTITSPTTMPTTSTSEKAYNMKSRLCSEKTEECLTVSALVLASVLSFVAGIFCTMVIVCVIRFIRIRHDKSNSMNKMESAGDAQKATSIASHEDKMKRGDMTYESLAKKVSVAESSTDHVYLGLDTYTDSNKQPIVTNKYGNSHTGTREKSKAITEKTSDPVYNVLEMTTNNENTYTGLTGRGPDNIQPLRDSQKDSETQNRSSEVHYFVLRDEASGNGSGERNVIAEEISGKAENLEDNRTPNDIDYFILEKNEHSDSALPELKQNEETSAKEPEYHILEKEQKQDENTSAGEPEYHILEKEPKQNEKTSASEPEYHILEKEVKQNEETSVDEPNYHILEKE